MSLKNELQRAALFVALLALLCSWAATPACGQAGARVAPPAPTKYYLGVYGGYTTAGFFVTSVVPKSPASRLPLGAPGGTIRLEYGDWITEVDGNVISPNWTLSDAIAASNGTISLKVWDGRIKGFRFFGGVELDPRPR